MRRTITIDDEKYKSIQEIRGQMLIDTAKAMSVSAIINEAIDLWIIKYAQQK